MTRVAKGTLLLSCIITSLVIWGVHFQQSQEREVRNLFSNSFILFDQILLRRCTKACCETMSDDEKKWRRGQMTCKNRYANASSMSVFSLSPPVLNLSQFEHCPLRRKGGNDPGILCTVLHTVGSHCQWSFRIDSRLAQDLWFSLHVCQSLLSQSSRSAFVPISNPKRDCNDTTALL